VIGRARASSRQRSTTWLAFLTLSMVVTMATAGARPLVAAHRGGAALAPENSVATFRNAIGLGVDLLEFDLHLTRDGEVVVIRDATLDRTTTATGAVRERTLGELATARLRARDGAVTDERVPTFAEVLDLARPTSVGLLPEIKVGATGDAYPGIAEKTLALLRSRELLDRATIQAFQPATIERIRTIAPAARTMLLVGRSQAQRRHAGTPIEWARAAGATDLGIDHRLVDPKLVSAAREARIRLSVWTVNEAPDITRMLALGVDVIMSDRPDLVKQLAAR
jgi:glycerophosphoryl diester phosphodiesterase